MLLPPLLLLLLLLWYLQSCPDINSPDYDFAQAPMLVTACKGCRCKQLVVAGQKSGWLWALAPDTVSDTSCL
jgi:hypothetical protein